MKFLYPMMKIILIDFRYFVAISLRLFIIILTDFLYYKYNIVYTDIDYHVLSDGAKHLINLESPYNRETYRYTPILAMMMIPNHIIFYSMGKIVLSIIDVLVGLSIEILLNIQNKKKNKEISLENSNSNEKPNLFEFLYSYINNPFAYYSLLYLYNPITINICTRGSMDCIVTFLVIMTIILIELGLYPLAGIIYGFSIHFKIYPIIYAPALYLYLISKDVSISKILSEGKEIKMEFNSEEITNVESYLDYLIAYFTYCYHLFLWAFKTGARKFLQVSKILIRSLFHYKAIIFAGLTITTFCCFFAFFYVLYGNKFLYEYFIYHLVRKDHRHNYSIFYYIIYLTYSNSFSRILSLITFIPQTLLIMISTLFLFQNINLCLLILTMVFVTFNKVITAQYFIWYISLIPLIAPYNKLFDYNRHGGKVIYGLFLFAIWLYFELVWNSYSYGLEFKGENLFLTIWGINIVFFLINCLITKEILVSHCSINI